MKSALTLKCSRIGDLESLHWVEAPELKHSDVAVTVCIETFLTDIKKYEVFNSTMFFFVCYAIIRVRIMIPKFHNTYG